MARSTMTTTIGIGRKSATTRSSASGTRVGCAGSYTGALPEIASSEMTYHFGAEYRARTWLPVRGGVVLIRRDPDRGDGIPPLKGIRMTAGLGYFWHFLDTQVDASYTHEHVRFTPGDPSEELSRSDRASIVFRYLF